MRAGFASFFGKTWNALRAPRHFLDA